ncbi:MAG TPA: hypothetical protein PLN61_15190 [bacterium]|nr:hypothetical protein [bacterium]HQI49995.1 hypothetical protein [bacterium]HQJ65641.1 hypothetical protein [bacterium]
MDQEFHAALLALGEVQRGLDLYLKGRRQNGSQVIDTALDRLSRLLEGPEWQDFFSQVADYLAGLEMADLGRMESLAPTEAGLLKKYGLTARDLLQLQRLYKVFKTCEGATDLTDLFAMPGSLVARLTETVAAVEHEIDRTRSLPRKVKKTMKKVAGSRLTFLLVGSALIGMNLFWKKEQQTSVSVGVVFLTSALKK